MDPAALGTLLIGLDAIDRDGYASDAPARRSDRRHPPINWTAPFRRFLAGGLGRSVGRPARRVRYTPDSGVGL
jgi:hypothetical protein